MFGIHRAAVVFTGFFIGSTEMIGAQQAGAATLSLNALDDTTIVQAGDSNFFDSNNYGGRNDLRLGNYFEQSTLVRFDTTGLAAVLAGGTVSSVTLNFTLAADTTTAGTPVTLAQLSTGNAGWVEGTGGGAGAYAAAGATRFFSNKDANSGSGSSNGTGTVWAGGGNLSNYYAGGNQFQGNAASTHSLGSVIGTYTIGQTLSLTIPNSIVTGWVADANLAAAGLYLVIDGGGNGFTFASTEAGAGAPTVTIEYTAAAVPEPTAMAIVGAISAISMLKRSRRHA